MFYSGLVTNTNIFKIKKKKKIIIYFMSDIVYVICIEIIIGNYFKKVLQSHNSGIKTLL